MTPFDYAALAAFAVLHAAVEKNVQISAVNFSSNALIMPWLNPSRENIISAEFLFMHYYGGGTEVPTKKIISLLKQKNDAVVLIITDSEIGNCPETSEMVSNLASRYTILIIQIGSRENTEFSKAAKELGAGVQYVQKIEDLPLVALRTVKPFFI